MNEDADVLCDGSFLCEVRETYLYLHRLHSRDISSFPPSHSVKRLRSMAIIPPWHVAQMRIGISWTCLALCKRARRYKSSCLVEDRGDCDTCRPDRKINRHVETLSDFRRNSKRSGGSGRLYAKSPVGLSSHVDHYLTRVARRKSALNGQAGIRR
jgi:hypothetical protein